jgi:hypothetical protein
MKGIVAISLVLVAALTPAVSSAQDMVIVDYDGLPPNYSNLQDGIDAVSDGGTVYVIATLSTGPEQVSFLGPRNRGLSFGGKNITLTTIGGGPEKFAIDCQGQDRAFLLSAAVDTTSQIIGFTIMNGTASGGGAIRCEGGTPRITDCVFQDNSAEYGGAVSLTQGPARFTGCEFYGNSATGGGGAVHAGNSQLRMNACTFGDNAANGGGCIWLGGSDLTLKLCTLSNNEDHRTVRPRVRTAGQERLRRGARDVPFLHLRKRRRRRSARQRPRQPVRRPAAVRPVRRERRRDGPLQQLPLPPRRQSLDTPDRQQGPGLRGMRFPG